MNDMRPRKGQIVELTVESLAPGGEGVSKDLGMPVFIGRAARGDRAEVELFDVRGNFARGKIHQLLSASPDRAEPPCKLFKVCGGCQWQHMSYPAQIAAKQDILRQSLTHLGKLSPDLVQEPIGADRGKELFYRNKVQFPVRSPQDSKRILAGYFKQDSHELVNIKHCPVQPEPLDRLLNETKEICERLSIPAYDEEAHRGLLRFINARISRANGRVLVTLVLNCAPERLKDHVHEAAAEIMKALPEVSGVCLNFNTTRGNKILGDTTMCVAGEPHIIEVYKTDLPELPTKLQDGIQFRLSSSSFFQIHTEQAVKLLERLSGILVEHYPKDAPVPLSESTLIDAYAGVGAMSLWLAPFVQRVIAIEENPSSISDGNFNKELNGIANVEFKAGRVEQVLPSLQESGLAPEVIVLDPPRKGLAPELIEPLVKLNPQVIIYVSCNPATLARDLNMIESEHDAVSQSGYKTRQVIPIDLFPQTYHVESIAVLTRQ